VTPSTTALGMSSRARKAQKLSKRDSSDSTKHARNSHESSRKIGDGSDESDFGEQDFAAIRIGEFLETDPRPSFAVTSEINIEDGFEPVFSNDALRSNYSLTSAIGQKYNTNSPPTSPKLSSAEFKTWIQESAQHEKSNTHFPRTFSFFGLIWTAFTIRRWTIISGSGSNQETKGISGNLPLRSESPNVPQLDLSRENRLSRTRNASIPRSLPQHQSPAFVTPGTPDWTLPQPSGDLSPHIIFARSIDWASTPLGDMSSWSREFRQVANLLMGNPHPVRTFGEQNTSYCRLI